MARAYARAVPAPGVAADPLLQRAPWLAVLRQGVPLAFGFASHALINLVDLALVGRLGGDALQAAHIGSTWNVLPMIVGNCVSTALLASLSRDLGAGDVASARARNRRAQAFVVGFALLLALLTTLPAGPMVDLMAAGPNVRADALHYLVVSNLGCVTMFVLMQTTAAMRAVGEVLMPVLLLLGANVVNLALAVPLLYGWDAVGLPAVGVVGAAYAAVAARTLAAVVAVAWLWRARHPLSLRAAAGATPPVAPQVALPLLRDAWPQSLQIGLRAGLVLLLTPLLRNGHGEGAAIAFSITTRYDTVVLFASIGFANAATAYAGRAVVAGRERAARHAGFAAAVQAALFGALCVLAMIAFAYALVGWCLPGPSPAVVAFAADYFAGAGWSQVAGAAALGAIGAVQGAGAMQAPLRLDLLGFAVAYAAVLLVGEGSTAALYLALGGGMVVVALLQLGLVARGRWARPE
jgi:Na+-driven multidrug efflux pump